LNSRRVEKHMPSEEAQDSPTTAVTREPRPIGLTIDLEEVESAVLELLRRYRIALQFVSDMPLLGPSAISDVHESDEEVKYVPASRWRARWGSRPLTRVYVETHVRKQLRAIRECLRLELIGSTPGLDGTERIAALEGDLEGAAEPLFRWRRFIGLAARLPPIAAALPVLAAASARPFAEDVSVDTVLSTLLWLVATALVLWILVVWPSIRLGFRVKRAIFAGGVDLRHPFLHEAGKVHWEGFRAPGFCDDPARSGETRPDFPTNNVYAGENDVFRALERHRKPAEVPLDLLFGLAPYLWYVGSVLFFSGLIAAVVWGWSQSVSGWIILAVVSLVAFAGMVLIPIQGARNYGTRRH
jgi:hypothetical protein